MLFIIFSLAVCFIFGIANFYIYKRMIQKFILFKYLHKTFAFLFTLLFIMQMAFFWLRKLEINDELYGFLAMLYAPTYCLFFMTLALDFTRLMLKFWAKEFKSNLFLKIFLEIVFIIVAIYASYLSVHNALKTPELKEITITLKKLDRNLKVAMLADIHLGKNLHEEFLDKLISKVNAQKPDLVVIVGDLIDTNPKDLQNYIHKLDNFESKFGTFYALGNHEYYHGINEVIKLLKEQTHMKILINENFDLGFINIAGLADLTGLKKGLFAPDLGRITRELDTTKASILLAHQPKTALLYDLGAFDLVLSGHTHGGQIFPFMILVKLAQGFLYGLYDLNEKTQLFITKGAGFWGPSLRVLANSEIVIINLKGER